MKNTTDIRKHILKRMTVLETDFNNFKPHLQDLNRYIMPRQARFMPSDKGQDKRNRDIIVNTATMAANTLSSGMMTGVTSPARPWFNLTTDDQQLADNPAVKAWLYEVVQRMREVFIRSNLYNALPQLYMDLGVYGTGAIFEDEDDEDGVRFYVLPVGSYVCAVSARGTVDTMYRRLRLSVRNLVEMFGEETVSESVRGMYRGGRHDQMIDVIHAVEPNLWRDHGKIDATNMEYASVWMEANCPDDKLLRFSGYAEFPVMVPRWSVLDGEVWGYGPGMVALPDIKALQLESKQKLKMIAKIADPPMVGPSSLMNQRASLLPGDITYVDASGGMQGFQPAQTVDPGALNWLIQDIQECEQRIRRAFFEDLFLMLAQTDRRQITAREIEERHEEKLLVLGSVVERLNEELLDPLIDRTFGIMSRRGFLPEPPEELQGSPLKIEYISIMSQAQKMVGISGIERLTGFVGQVAQASPAVLDRINFDEAVEEYGRMLGVPPSVVLSDEQVASIRSDREQQAQAAQAMQMAQQGAAIAKDASQAKTGGEDQNMLTDVMRMMGAG